MAYAGAEKRKHTRLSKTFVVSYRVYEEVDNYDLTQTKNVSVGGMLLTTNRKFNPGTILSVDIRLPYLLEPLNLKARVIDSKQIVKNLIYDTHLELIDIDEDNKEIINKTVVFHLKKKEEEK
ncbi:MAG: PilZ domain-containing protein, partial [Candidatus Omnitrophota bacterium]